MQIFKKIINKDFLCFDVGANVGKKTEKLLAHGANVICIEPQSKCASMLNEKFKNNDNVKIVNVALGEKQHTSVIFTSPSHTVSTMSKEFIDKTSAERFKKINWNGSESVNVTTLDNLIKLYGLPNYCKIDVEGYELQVLKGLSQPIEIISIEFTPELKQNTFECIKLLNKLGKYVYNYSEGESGVFTFDEWVADDVIINFLKKNL